MKKAMPVRRNAGAPATKNTSIPAGITPYQPVNDMKTMGTVHIGRLVTELLKKKKMKQAGLAKILVRNKSNVSMLLKREDWRVSEVVAASEYTHVNLFEYIYKVTDKTEMVEEETPLYQIKLRDSQLKQCQEQLADERDRRKHSDERADLLKEKVRRLEIENASLKNPPKT